VSKTAGTLAITGSLVKAGTGTISLTGVTSTVTLGGNVTVPAGTLYNSTTIDAAIKVVADRLTAHDDDTVQHITASERTYWNAKAPPTMALTAPTTTTANIALPAIADATIKNVVQSVYTHMHEANNYFEARKLNLAGGTMTGRLITRNNSAGSWYQSMISHSAIWMPKPLNNESAATTIMAWQDNYGNVYGIGAQLTTATSHTEAFLSMHTDAQAHDPGNPKQKHIIGLSVKGDINALALDPDFKIPTVNLDLSNYPTRSELASAISGVNSTAGAMQSEIARLNSEIAKIKADFMPKSGGTFTGPVNLVEDYI
jgi:Tfp pilus assembly major pilin PilA